MSVTVSNPSSNLSGKELVITEGTHTITGPFTFDRDPSAPFAVTSGSAVVTNLDSDKLDGQHGSYYLDTANHTGTSAADAAWPIGSVFIAVVATNPATLLGVGTWSAFATGRVLIGIDSGQAALDTIEETGGAMTHTHTGPSHTHTLAHTHTFSETTGIPSQTQAVEGGAADTEVAWYQHTHTVSGTTSAASVANTGADGTGNTGNNSATAMPYIVVHMWKRTA